MNGSEPKLPGLTDDEMDQLMDAQLSVADSMASQAAQCAGPKSASTR